MVWILKFCSGFPLRLFGCYLSLVAFGESRNAVYVLRCFAASILAVFWFWFLSFAFLLACGLV